MSFDTAQPYIASYVILRSGNKIAFVLRKNTHWMDNFYGLPSGKVEKKESFSKAAIREAKEETDVVVLPENLKHILTVHRYEPSSDATDWVDIYFEAIKWDGEPYNAEPHMHTELAWLDLNVLPENIIPAVRFALEQIKAGNTFAEYGWEV